MSIKFKREHLERIVREELAKYLAEQLNEAPGRGTVLDDPEQQEVPQEDEVPNPGEAPEESLPTDSPAPEAGDEPGMAPDLEGDETEMDQDLDAIEAGEEPPSEEEEGTVAGELSGKTIEHIKVEEESKIMPGATEVILSFRESPDAFRLLITKTGKVKFFYRGLHNTLDAQISPMPEDDAPEEDEEMQDMGGEELEDMPPLGDEDMPPEEPPAPPMEPTEDEEELP